MISAAAEVLRPPRLVCIGCGQELAPGELGGGCASCAERGVATNATTDYDLESAREAFLRALDGPVRSPGRYEALLPVRASQLTSLDAGSTPLLEAPRLAAEIGLERLWIKDESQGLTWSFKDRAASIAAAHARALGRPGLVVASTGNAAAATCAHARRAGLPALVLFSRGVDPLMSAFVRAYGCPVVTAPTKAVRWELMGRCVDELGVYPNSNFADPPVGNSPYAIDGYKPLGYEIFEQLGRRLPERVYFPVCYGDALWGVWHAFLELEGMGLVGAGRVGGGGADGLPKLSGGEIQGTLERALDSGAETPGQAEPPRPTVALSIAGAPSTVQALTAVRDSGGHVSAVSDEELLDAQTLLAEREGLFVETASAAGLASLIRHLGEDRVRPGDEVVLVNSSSGLKSVGAGAVREEPPAVRDFDELMEEIGASFNAQTGRSTG